MVEAVAFKPVKEFGTIILTDESEIKFYVDQYKGFTYASARTFLKRAGYSGPTKAGITLSSALLNNVLETMGKLPAQAKVGDDKELARFPKKPGIELVVRITSYKDTVGVDLREWVDDGDYQGWSKKGVRIPYQEISKAMDFLREMKEFLVKK